MHLRKAVWKTLGRQQFVLSKRPSPVLNGLSSWSWIYQPQKMWENCQPWWHMPVIPDPGGWGRRIALSVRPSVLHSEDFLSKKKKTICTERQKKKHEKINLCLSHTVFGILLCIYVMLVQNRLTWYNVMLFSYLAYVELGISCIACFHWH